MFFKNETKKKQKNESIGTNETKINFERLSMVKLQENLQQINGKIQFQLKRNCCFTNVVEFVAHCKMFKSVLNLC